GSNDADVVDDPDHCLTEVAAACEATSGTDGVSAPLDSIEQVDSLDRVPGIDAEPVKLVLEEWNVGQPDRLGGLPQFGDAGTDTHRTEAQRAVGEAQPSGNVSRAAGLVERVCIEADRSRGKQVKSWQIRPAVVILDRDVARLVVQNLIEEEIEVGAAFVGLGQSVRDWIPSPEWFKFA